MMAFLLDVERAMVAFGKGDIVVVLERDGISF
jgi:hypothetical protein